MVLNECMVQGLAAQLAGHYLLVAHDIFLENSSKETSFGIHEDGWSLEIFYQTDEDLTVYIPLQDTVASTGGRLLVDPTFEASPRHRQRNRLTKDFSNLCEKLGCVDGDGYATREVAVNCDAALQGFRRLRSERDALPRPDPDALRPIDARVGEVILFANKHFHSVEPWAPHNPSSRAVYIVRLTPIYDVKLRPPSAFLGGEPCNRFILDPRSECLLPVDQQTKPLRRYSIPLPPLGAE